MGSQKRREVEVVVISDLHLGTYGCQAKELLRYLKSIKPKILILNGDIIDIWQFSKRYWPKAHMQVVKQIMSMITKDVTVYYVTGNHDEMMRKFVGFKLGTFEIVNKVVIELDGEQAWFFHGDVFDVTMKHSKWLAKMGAVGYDLLIMINSVANWVSSKLGKGKVSFSKKVKDKVKGAVKHINDFEQIAADIAIEKGYKYVGCGHIHKPTIKMLKNAQGETIYLNSGDWIENLTALEYNLGEWSIYQYRTDQDILELEIAEDDDANMNYNQLFDQLVTEFQIVRP